MVAYESLDYTMSTSVQYDLLEDSANQCDACLELLHTVKTIIGPPFCCLRVRKLDEPSGIVYKLSRSSLVQYIRPEETQQTKGSFS